MKYMINDIWYRSSHTDNYYYYNYYNFYKFEAENDEQAIKIVEDLQAKIEKEIKEDEGVLEDFDPVLVNHIIKLIDEENNEWLSVEY